jgi:Fe-S-cluster containining protein
MWHGQHRRAFWDTAAGQQILTLDLIFRKISEAQQSFIRQAAQHVIRLTCPPGCGACCHGFMPDVLPVEADYIAYFLLSHETKLTGEPELSRVFFLVRAEGNPSPCPFHDPGRPGENCRIYEARPLVCRLFGFSSTQTKRGGIVYRLCRHMPTPQGLTERTLGRDALMRSIGAAPPLMSGFALEMLAIDPSRASERRPLSEALPPALARIAASLHYCPEEPNAA